MIRLPDSNFIVLNRSQAHIQSYSADIDATHQDKRRIDIYFTQEFVIFISRPMHQAS